MKYYYLQEGDTIKENDEVEVSNSIKDDEKWQKTKCVGQKAPNPNYPAHRRYRRSVE